MVIFGTLKILMDPDEQIWWNNGNYGNIGNMVFTHFFQNDEGHGTLVIMVILGTLKILVDPDEQICWNNGNYGNKGNMVFTHFFKMKKAMEYW